MPEEHSYTILGFSGEGTDKYSADDDVWLDKLREYVVTGYLHRVEVVNNFEKKKDIFKRHNNSSWKHVVTMISEDFTAYALLRLRVQLCKDERYGDI